MIPEWQQLLNIRGILESARDAGWHPQDRGWSYPLYNQQGKPHTTKANEPIKRWKAFDSAAEFKYLWIPKGLKEQKPRYYLLPDTLPAIARSGSVILASGEPDVLAFRASGAKNVLCWFGEGQTPATLKEDLLLFGVTSIEGWPDLDPQGTTWAQSITNKLAGSSITINLHALPKSLGEKGDINKLWINQKFDPVAFWDTLILCEGLNLQPQGATIPLIDHFTHSDFPQAFYDAIHRALGIEKYKGDGWSNPVKCVLSKHEHDDQKPAAAWNREKHIYSCLKCGVTEMLAKDIATKLDIDYREYLLKSTPAAKPKPSPVAQPDQPPTPISITTWGTATAIVMDELNGKLHDSFHEPLTMPLRNIARLGGLAQKMLPGKVMAIQADSGHGKTSFIECWVDYQRRMGHAGVIWGPEWTNTEYIYRAIQRQGGPSFMQIVDDKAYRAAEQRNVPINKRNETPLTDEQRDRAREELRKMSLWPGTLSFIDKMGLNVHEVITGMNEVALGYEAHGLRLAYAVCDYAQLLQATGTKANERVDMALAAFKAFCVDRQLVGVVGSQVVKEAGKAAQGGKRMSQHDMQNTRGDYFNLVIAISRELDESTGEVKSAATARVTKNSLGKNADAPLFLNGDRMTWHDAIVEHVNINSLYNGSYDEKED